MSDNEIVTGKRLSIFYGSFIIVLIVINKQYAAILCSLRTFQSIKKIVVWGHKLLTFMVVVGMIFYRQENYVEF